MMKRKCVTKSLFTATLGTLLWVFATTTNAAAYNESTNFDLRVAAGTLNGESGEYVYDAYGSDSGIPGYKISELNWTLEDVVMVGVAGSYQLGDWLRFNAEGWVNAEEGDATMDDYDWLYVGAEWSHWSHHENTTVDNVMKFDFNGQFTFYDIDKVRLFSTLGYKQDHFEWESIGGEGIYSVSDFRDTQITFSDIPVISYEQTFRAPYIGLGLTSVGYSGGQRIELNMSFNYSPLVEGEDVDIHHLRDLRFEEQGDGGEWSEFKVALVFQLTEALSMDLAYYSQEYDEIKATTLVTDLTTGTQTFYSGDAAGLDHRSSLFSLGLQYQF